MHDAVIELHTEGQQRKAKVAGEHAGEHTDADRLSGAGNSNGNPNGRAEDARERRIANSKRAADGHIAQVEDIDQCPHRRATHRITEDHPDE